MEFFCLFCFYLFICIGQLYLGMGPDSETFVVIQMASGWKPGEWSRCDCCHSSKIQSPACGGKDQQSHNFNTNLQFILSTTEQLLGTIIPQDGDS